MAEERVLALDEEVSSLQTRLSFEQRNVHALQQRLQQLDRDHPQARHFQQLYLETKDRCSQLDDQLYKAERKAEKLKEKYDDLKRDYEDLSEKYRLMKRGISQHGHDNEYYRTLYE